MDVLESCSVDTGVEAEDRKTTVNLPDAIVPALVLVHEMPIVMKGYKERKEKKKVDRFPGTHKVLIASMKSFPVAMRFHEVGCRHCEVLSL